MYSCNITTATASTTTATTNSNKNKDSNNNNKSDTNNHVTEFRSANNLAVKFILTLLKCGVAVTCSVVH